MRVCRRQFGVGCRCLIVDQLQSWQLAKGIIEGGAVIFP